MTTTAWFTLEDYLSIAADEDARIAAEQEHYKAQRAAERFEQWEQARDFALQRMPELRAFTPRLPLADDNGEYSWKLPDVIWEATFPDQETVEFGTRRNASALSCFVRNYPYTGWAEFYSNTGQWILEDTPEQDRRTFLALLVRASWRLEREEVERLERVAERAEAKETAVDVHIHEWHARLARQCSFCNAVVVEESDG